MSDFSESDFLSEEVLEQQRSKLVEGQGQNPSENRFMYRFSVEKRKWSKHTVDTKPPPTNTKTFAIATWNVDFSRGYLAKRLMTSLDHLQSLIEPLLAGDPPIPTIILIQELDDSLFRTLLQHPFVQKHYDLTDISSASWRIHYGTVTLAPRSLEVRSAFRTIFESSRMGRDALFIDVSFPSEDTDDVRGDPRVIRVANVHLESLDGHGDIERPRQLEVVSSRLSEPGLHGGIVGGDMNPIGPRDDAVPGELGFVDGWTLCHDKQADNDTVEGATATTPEEVKRRNAEGHTWGYQPPSRYPPRRMDKVLFVGNVTVKKIERFGVGLAVDPSKIKGKSTVWASDHYGLLATFEIV